MSLADQKVEITPLASVKRQRQPPSKKLELSFLESVSHADQKMETTPNPKRWNLGFWSQCHLLIKGGDIHRSCRRCSPPRWRYCLKTAGVLCQGGDTTTSKVGTSVFGVSVTCWSKGRQAPHPKVGTYFFGHVSLADQKVETTSPSKKLELRFLDSVSLADQKENIHKISRRCSPPRQRHLLKAVKGVLHHSGDTTTSKVGT